ncbi:hypothetical protein [Solicola sp. PLA-1-18]|uniref:hypothetical protein n=1 Tax=Solicola sp. PLA-1-18 TaxID=3380532 RepID=UPI003B761C98
MTTAAHPARRSWPVTVRDVVLLAAAGAGAWWAWLGWDHTYYTDPATGYAAGPYRPWQVVGCVLTLLAVAAIAYVRLRPLVVGVVVTIAFTVAFASSAMPGDDTGLAGVGVVMVLVGTALAATVLGSVATAVRTALARR